MPQRYIWILIENFSQQVFTFSSLRELKEFAKKKKLYIRKSPCSDRTYYTEGF